MLYKNLGRTGLKVSALAFGGGIGGAYSDIADYSGIDSTLRKCIDLGVNFVDTSPVYGNGESESIIGDAIKDIRKDVVLATKVMPGRTNYQGVIKSAEESLKRLKTDCIDLYQIHWPNPSVPIEETISAMEELIQQGKIRYFGVSNFSFREVNKAFDSLNYNWLTSVQTEYNFCERSIENDILPYCQKNEITVIAYTPLMRGRMAGSIEQLNLLKQISKKYNATVPQIILSWIAKIRGVIVLTNTKSIPRANENFRSCDIELSEEDYSLIGNVCVPPIQMIDTKFILEFSDLAKTGYNTLEEAINNSLEWVPSPQDLSQQMTQGEFLKPIRLRKIQKNGKPGLELLEGKLRFWSWVAAFGWNKKIPSIVWKD